MEESAFWRKCSTCKKPIGLGANYFVCSVSTCNGLRTGYVFCTLNCFESHLPGARHRTAGAVDAKAPMTPYNVTSARIVSQSPSPKTTSTPMSSQEVLVIASRLKEYISDRSGFNTSGSVMEVLSDHLRIICERAIDSARADGRKTVMDRDFEFLKR